MRERFSDAPGVGVGIWGLGRGVSKGNFRVCVPVEAASSRLAVTRYDNLEDEHETTHWHIGERSSATGVGAGDPFPGSAGASRNASAMYFGGAEFFFGDCSSW